MLSTASYIKSYRPLSMDTPLDTGAPRFRRRFSLTEKPVRAEVLCAGLGYGYFYINGKPVSKDLFTAAVSDYTKTVWYNRYDVTELLQDGENVAAAILGNGFYNEAIDSAWGHFKAPWRDVPKLIFCLVLTYADGRTETVISDDKWLCTDRSPYLYNALRSGETYDARLEEPGWNDVDFDETGWKPAIVVEDPKVGVLRECLCEPIREFEVYDPIRVTKYGDRWLFEFPQNISGYVRLRTGSLLRGQRLTVRYAEDINEDGTLNFFDCFGLCRRPGLARYAYSEYISDGSDEIWSPRFSYFGFRYMEVTGINGVPPKDLVKAVFVHQNVARKTSFVCSDYRLNQLYHMGIFATWSNMFYMPTDCPTREKLGWGNDAQASTEQFLTNFDSAKFLTKWHRDIVDSMREEDGAIPAIIPSPGWGYDNTFAGPNCAGVLYEIPYRIYEYNGDKTLLCQHLPEMRRYLAYLRTRANENGLIGFGLPDWASPQGYENTKTPKDCSDTLLYIKFLRITALAAELVGEDTADLVQEEKRMSNLFISVYFNEDGTMKDETQCALAMAYGLNVCPDRKIIGQQLIDAVERDNRHLSCGMLGVQYIYNALEDLDRSDLTYALITAVDFPSFMNWIDERRATTLCENYKFADSQNHHMFSCFIPWLMKNLGGIRPAAPGFAKCTIKPYFPENLSYCFAWEDTPLGRVSVDWKRNGDGISITISLPAGMEGQLEYKGTVCPVTGSQTLRLNV